MGDINRLLRTLMDQAYQENKEAAERRLRAMDALRHLQVQQEAEAQARRLGRRVIDAAMRDT